MKHIIGILFIGLLTFTSCKVKPTEENVNPNPKVESKAKVSEANHGTEGLTWLTMSEIEAAVRKDPKPVMVDVYTSWCGPCKMLDKYTFTNPEVQEKLNKNFHIVKFNAEGPDDVTFNGKVYKNPDYKEGKRGRNGQHQLGGIFKVRGYPSMVIFDTSFKTLGKIVGYKTPEQLLPELDRFIR